MLSTVTYSIEGFVKIFDPESGEIFVDKKNAVNYENLSEALAFNLGNKSNMYVSEMVFGNGGTSVDPTGVINYLPTNTNTTTGNLYNPTYYKIIDDTNVNNTDPTRNKVTISHIPGKVYTDVIITCLLDYGEPAGQAAFDNTQNLDGTFVFDELGIRAYSTLGPGLGKLLTHVVFHPTQKALNRLIQIDYTIRVQSLTSLLI